MGTVFQIGESGIEAINDVNLARVQDDTLTIEGSAIIDVQSPENTTQTRTFSFGSNGLNAMLTENGITDLTTPEGQVSVVEGTDATVADIPGFTNKATEPTPEIDPTTPNFS